MNQYPKAISAVLVGLLYYLAKKYLGLEELLTEDYRAYFDLVINGLVVYLFGRERITSDAKAKQIEVLRQ
ncbi:MAG: hypothetical protein IPG99_20010 [Ignavibacteria bacterium]|nr:hypothetical protein [Ignavibacteria bacterium]